MSPTIELEKEILGGLILRPALLETSDIKDTDFAPGETRKAFSAIAALWEESRPQVIDEVILAERLGGDGSVTFVTGLVNGNIKIAPEIFNARLEELRHVAMENRARTRLMAILKDGFDLDLIDEALEECRKPQIEGSLFDMGRTFAEVQALNVNVEWLVPGLLPEKAITLLHGAGGAGKTWLSLQMALAITTGGLFLGTPSQRRPVVYTDFEMPIALMRERVLALGLTEGRLWHLGDSPPPPRLDSDGWKIYLQARDSVLIFDSLRSAHAGAGNDDFIAADIMARIKEIREAGNTVLLVHHTPRRDERTSKGSTAWTDLSDHVLSFYPVKPRTFLPVEEESEPDPDAIFYFGTGEKSRYPAFRLYLRRSESGDLVVAEDPAADNLDLIRDLLLTAGADMNQTDLFKWIKENLGVAKKITATNLLQKGERRRLWSSQKIGYRRLYHAL